jgi:ATP-dependent exoDNAse (exonuclease V) alpha subunit
VAIPLSSSHFMMLNNKWFYTAITRAEKKVYLIGQKFALKQGCTNIDATKRNTFLSLKNFSDQEDKTYAK